MTSDLDLLRQFAHENSQDAFAEIVRRHINLVYSAALRQVRSPQLAEEIAQSVFADLARVAATPWSPLRGSDASLQTSLTPWLYAVTRRTAIDVIRKESRRQMREQIAVEMNNMNATANDWTQIEPLLDDAMAALDETDRSAVLLRYFENKSLREVGEALGASEDAAQKRMSRAVERLRDFFSRRNVTIGASGLAVLISANAVQSAPVGLAAAISGAAILAGTAVHTSTVIAASKVVAMTTLQKTIIGAALTAAVGTGVFEAHQDAQLRDQVQTLQQQQAPLAEQILELRREHNDATNRLAGLREENAQLRSNSNENELLKLRAEVTRLKADSEELARMQVSNTGSLTETVAKDWTAKVDLIKEYLQKNPDAGIPEIQFMTDRDWLSSIDPSANYWPLASDKDYKSAMDIARDQAQLDFEGRINDALQKFSKDNNLTFPTDLAQLRPYLDSAVAGVLEQQYEMVSTSKLPASSLPNNGKVEGDWMIGRKSSARERGQRMAIVPIRMRIGGAIFYQMAFY